MIKLKRIMACALRVAVVLSFMYFSKKYSSTELFMAAGQ